LAHIGCRFVQSHGLQFSPSSLDINLLAFPWTLDVPCWILDIRLLPYAIWDLYDMYGNVCECCLDSWHSNYTGCAFSAICVLLVITAHLKLVSSISSSDCFREGSLFDRITIRINLKNLIYREENYILPFIVREVEHDECL
jgi:hypothetical protein